MTKWMTLAFMLIMVSLCHKYIWQGCEKIDMLKYLIVSHTLKIM